MDSPCPMIRLAVCGVHEVLRQEIASRLRGALIAPADGLGDCDAAVFFDSLPDDALLEHCLNVGKPVLLSIKGGVAQERLQSLFALSTKHQTLLSPVNLDHYLPSRQLIRQQLDSGKLGEPGLLRLHRWKPPRDDRGSLVCDLELVITLFGKAPNVVYAVTQGIPDSSTPPGILVHLGFAGGGMALLDHQPLPTRDGYTSLTLIGSSGAAYADDHSNVQLIFGSGAARAVRVDEGVAPYVAAIEDFVEVLRAGRDLSAQRMRWHNAFATVEAVHSSLRDRQAITPREFV
jgi:predicted dehydrogenase